MKLRLGDVDRERLGCDEWIEFNPVRFSNVEAREIRRMFDVGHDEWLEGLKKSGPPVTGDGTPLSLPDYLHCWVWIALRRAGVTVPIDELEFDTFAVETESDVADDPGKAPPDETGSSTNTDPSS